MTTNEKLFFVWTFEHCPIGGQSTEERVGPFWSLWEARDCFEEVGDKIIAKFLRKLYGEHDSQWYREQKYFEYWNGEIVTKGRNTIDERSCSHPELEKTFREFYKKE